MKALKILGATAALAVVAAAAWAGGCGCCGWACKNPCPLAQQATQCRSYGTENPASQKALADHVATNLKQI
jgi:hypothetical protein